MVFGLVDKDISLAFEFGLVVLELPSEARSVEPGRRRSREAASTGCRTAIGRPTAAATGATTGGSTGPTGGSTSGFGTSDDDRYTTVSPPTYPTGGPTPGSDIPGFRRQDEDDEAELDDFARPFLREADEEFDTGITSGEEAFESLSADFDRTSGRPNNIDEFGTW